MSTHRRLLQVLSSVVILSMLFSGFALPVASAQGQDGIKRELNAQTGKTSFLAPENGSVLSAAKALGISGFARPADPGMALAKRFGPEFGLKDPGNELTELKTNQSENGRFSVRYQQNYQGIPVIGGELIVNTNRNGDLYSINGEVAVDLSLSTQPTIASEEARQTALEGTAKSYGKALDDFTATEPELWIFDESLLQPSTRPAELVWRTEVTPKNSSLPIRELVLVNAERGHISLHFNQVDVAWGEAAKENTTLNSPIRNYDIQATTTGLGNSTDFEIMNGGLVRTYTANNGYSLPGTFLCDQGKGYCTEGNKPHADAAHIYAIGTYDLYFNKHGRSSIDNHNMVVLSTVHYGSNYANANWTGDQMIYGDAYGFPLADDVVAHELTHGVTEYESNLFYYYQSGAINESFSDLWGEYYDQNNNRGADSTFDQWYLGEEVSGMGALRNMSNPTLFGDPDRMSSINYYTGTGDNGGVHTNSGINNKAVFLMVAGSSFNGKTVTPLGWDKTAAIYYEANTNLLSSGADYSDLYFALQQACTNLIGGSKGITLANCIELKDAIDAVEMNSQPVPNFNTEAPYCTTGVPVMNVFSDGLESGTGNWSFSNGDYTRWQLDSPYGPYAHSGNHFLYADDYPDIVTDASARLTSFTVPSKAFLHFNHAYQFEGSSYYFDGGVLEYSVDYGTTWQDAGPLIDFNGYKGTIFSGFGNPLAGRSGFVGSSHGYISTRVNLVALAGKTVSFRWRMGLDESIAAWGWWVDDVKLYQCVPNPVGLGTYDDSNLTWIYSHGVGSWSDSNLFGLTAHYLDGVGRVAEFGFIGSQFVLLYTGYNNRGTLDVWVDGNLVGTINEYSPLASRVYQSRWTSGNLGAGTHNLRLVQSGGTIVDIDAIEVKNYTPPGIGMYDDTDGGWKYGFGTGLWSNNNLSGGMAHYLDAVDESAEFTFIGSQFVLLYTGYTNRGTLDVYIDDSLTKTATINEYSPLTNRVYQSRWTSGDLGAGQHKVKLVHASGPIVDIDGIEIKTYQAPPGTGTYDDTHAGWVYSNGISSWSNPGLSGGTAHYLDVVGRYAEFRFTGSQFNLLYTGYTNRGKLDVYVDQVYVGTIDEYSPLVDRVFQSQWASGNLGAGVHTVKLVHASGSIVDIDGIEIKNYTPPGIGTYDDSHPGWVYGSGTGLWSDSNLSGGTAHYLDAVGKSAEFTFIGSQFVLLYTGYTNRGTLDVYIDDSPTKSATINEYSSLANRLYQSRWASGDLGAGQHKVKLVHASGSIVDIDGIEIKNYQAPPGAGIYDDTHAGWVYGPGVSSWSNPGLTGGTAHFLDIVGRYAEFSFIGSQFDLLYTGYTNRGTLDVFVDGNKVGTIDENSPLVDRMFQSRWTSGNLGAGTHNLRLVHASGSIVDIDGIEIKNYTPPDIGTYDDTHMGWVYSNGVSSWSNAGLSGGSAHYLDVVGRSAEFSFTGSQFVLLYTGYNNRGALDVYIDGNPVKAATINEYSPLTDRVFQSRWASGDLGAGQHKVKLVHASGSIVDIDGIEIKNYQSPPGAGIYDDTHAGWVYGPGVSSWSNPGLTGGTAHYSDVVGRYAEFSFSGSQFDLLYTGYNNRGKLDVYIDHVYVGTIDEYNPLPDRVFQSRWTSGNLGAGNHTVSSWATTSSANGKP